MTMLHKHRSDEVKVRSEAQVLRSIALRYRVAAIPPVFGSIFNANFSFAST